MLLNHTTGSIDFDKMLINKYSDIKKTHTFTRSNDRASFFSGSDTRIKKIKVRLQYKTCLTLNRGCMQQSR